MIALMAIPFGLVALCIICRACFVAKCRHMRVVRQQKQLEEARKKREREIQLQYEQYP
jgi:hypothetical protein